MVNVLIVGATGYIGQALAQSLVRSGNHRVYGLARTIGKGQGLARAEVIPIIGSISESTELLKAIDTFHINIVVDVSGANQDSRILLEALKGHGLNRASTAVSRGMQHAPKLGFIYTSGTWVHGSSNKPINDLTPVDVSEAPTPPAQLVSWRAKLEKDILDSSDVLDVMIIRPALVYGRSNDIWSSLLEPIYSAVQSGASSAAVAVEPDSRPGLVHVDDVGSGLHCAVEKLPLISGTAVYPVFDLVTSDEAMREILSAAAKEFGFNGTVQLAGTEGNLFANALSTTFNGSSGRAKTILGWEPKRHGFVKEMDIHARAWIASKQETK